MQNGVNIGTRESDLNVQYGCFNLREEREMARTSLKYILTDCNDLRMSYIRLGFHLLEFERCGYYEDFGYPTLEEFCAVNIGLDKSVVSRCMNVASRFSKKHDSSPAATMFLDDRYREFSYSQLCEMLPLTDKELIDIKPSMTIKQIRDYKKNKKVSADSEVITSCDVATDAQKFNYVEFSRKKGIVEQNYIKNCTPINSRIIWLFDKDGKRIECNYWLDVLAITGDKIVLRKC